MKKRVIIYFLIVILIIVSIIFSVEYYSKNKSDDEFVTDDGSYENMKEEISAIGRVFYGSLESVYEGKGRVCSNEEEYIDEYIIANKNVKINVKKDERVKKGQIIYEENSDKIESKSDGIVTEINEYEEYIELKVLNFSKQYVEFGIPAKYANRVNYESDLKLSANKRINGKIIQMEYLIEDDMRKIKIGIDEFVMPGSEVDVSINLGKSEECLNIPEIFLYGVEGDRYCYLYDERTEEYQKVEVEIGEKFVCVEGDMELIYYEVVAGLANGDKVVSVEMK